MSTTIDQLLEQARQEQLDDAEKHRQIAVHRGEDRLFTLRPCLIQAMHDVLNIDVAPENIRHHSYYSDNSDGYVYTELDGFRFLVLSQSTRPTLYGLVRCLHGHQRSTLYNSQDNGRQSIRNVRDLLEVKEATERWQLECSTCLKEGKRTTMSRRLLDTLILGTTHEYWAAVVALLGNGATDKAISEALKAVNIIRSQEEL